MYKFERKICTWINDNIFVGLFIISTIISVIIRFSMKDYISPDMERCLIPWYQSIKSRGGFLALGVPIGNYNITYQTLIALITYIPISPEYLYKITSSIFDFLQAFLIYKLVMLTVKDNHIATIGYAIAVNFPIVLFNSALWGQCDSIFTFFCILALYFCLKEKYIWTFIAFGAGLAFKLQAIFLLPFFLFYYLRNRKFSFLLFFLVPIVMVVLSLGGLLQGQQLKAIVDIYSSQITESKMMSINYPSFWSIIIENYTESCYNEMYIYAILLSFLVLVILLIVLLQKKKDFSYVEYLKIAFLLSYTCVFFLPNMHERYGYLYIILGLIIAMVDYYTIPFYLVILIIDLIIYANYLFNISPNWQIISIVNAFCYSSYIFFTFKSVFAKEAKH